MKLKVLCFILCFFVFAAVLVAQDLKEAARKERERQAAIKNPSKVITNDDIATSKTSSKEESGAKTDQSPTTEEHVVDRDGHDERYWSGKFLAAKKRIADAEQQQTALEERIRDYSFKLLTRSDVYDREHLYPPLIELAKQDLEKNKKEQEDAKTALDDLYAALRNAGGPRAWAYSTLAEQKTPPEHPDRQYYLDRLKQLDDEYDAQEQPYKAERFRLINRRSPDKDDKLDMKTQNYGLGLDPSVPTLNDKINELEQKHQQARADLIREARRAGFTIP
jgi:hypothetical protein